MNSEFIFCPRCGAITPPGVCTNCGYKMDKEEDYINETDNGGNTQNSQPDYVSVSNDNSGDLSGGEVEKKKSHIGLIIGLFAGGLALIILIVTLAVVGIFAFAPMLIKFAYNPNTPPTQPTTPTPSIDLDEDEDEEDTKDEEDENKDEEEEEEDVDDEDEDDTDDIVDEYAGYSDTIESLYGGTSTFDYDNFV